MRLLPLAVLVFCVLPAKLDDPFAALGFDAASSKAKAEEKLLLVDFTATWCPPCKQMDKQTWPDDAVGKWIDDHAVAIQVDVDKLPDLVQRFGFTAIPTMIFLKDGAVLDRYTGFKSPEEFLSWGNDVLVGKYSTVVLAEQGAALIESDDVHARLDMARRLLASGQYELALQHFLWLWQHTRGGGEGSSTRLTLMLMDMASLANAYGPAHAAFLSLLNDAQDMVEAHDPPAALDWQEWSAMCRSFRMSARIIDWYESRKDDRGRLPASDASVAPDGMIPDDVFKALIEVDRPIDAARLYEDVRTMSHRAIDKYRAQRFKQVPDYELWTNLPSLYGAALADGRAEQAAGVASDLLSVLDNAGSRLLLVKSALDLSDVRPPQLGVWLDEAATQGADVSILRARLASGVPASAKPAGG